MFILRVLFLLVKNIKKQNTLFQNRSTFEKLLSLLQGSAWALAIAGGTYAFLLFYPFGFFTSLLMGLFFFLAGIFFVVVFEIAQIQIDKLEELQKQTKLLEKLSNKDEEDEKISHH